MADVERAVKFLSQVPLFQNLKRRQLESLARLASERTFAPDEVIVAQGQGGVGLFVLETGAAEVIYEGTESKTVVNELGPGDFFGELALIDGGARTASVVATKPTDCLAITRWDFMPLLSNDAEMAINILEEVIRRFRRALDSC